MQVQFHPIDAPDDVVATVTWREGDVTIDTGDDPVRAALTRAYRRTPVVTDDASYRRLGTSGEVVIQAGDLEWFRAVSQVRAPAETGLRARLIPGVTRGGYDPAADYRPFEAAIERLERNAGG
jgi:hypothetical protein